MKICPKCRNFYDDPLLRFCLKDGVPLAEIANNPKLLPEGVNYLNQVKSELKRQTRKQTLKKFFKILVSTVLTIMIISVVTLQSWVYLNKPENETKNEELLLTENTEIKEIPEIAETSESTETIEPTPKPTRKNENTQTNENKSNSNINKISNADRISNVNKNSNSNKNSNKISNINKNSNTNKNSNINNSNNDLPICNTANEKDNIKRSYGSYFFDKIKALQPSLSKQYMNQERQAVFVAVILNEFTVSVSADCSNANVNHPYKLELINRNGSRNNEKLEKNFHCTKSKTSKVWICN